MTERQEEQAALSALKSLDADEIRILDSEKKYDNRITDTIRELEETAAELAYLLPPVEPPDDLRSSILEAIRKPRRQDQSRTSFTNNTVPADRSSGGLGWLLAAVFGLIACGLGAKLVMDHQVADVLVSGEESVREQLNAAVAQSQDFARKIATSEQHIAKLDKELTDAKSTNALTNLQLAGMRSSIAEYEKGIAVIVWDSEAQEGKLKMEKMPPAQARKDYQLWVVDKATPNTPISAGIIKIGADGSAIMTFKPVSPVTTAAAFAVSIEKEGGVAKSAGPTVFLGP